MYPHFIFLGFFWAGQRPNFKEDEKYPYETKPLEVLKEGLGAKWHNIKVSIVYFILREETKVKEAHHDISKDEKQEEKQREKKQRKTIGKTVSFNKKKDDSIEKKRIFETSQSVVKQRIKLDKTWKQW